MFQNSNSLPTLPPGEEIGSPTKKRQHISTVQGNAVMPGCQGTEMVQQSPPSLRGEAACLLYLDCCFSWCCYQPGEEETGPAISFVCSMTSLGGLCLFVCFFLSFLKKEHLVIVSVGTRDRSSVSQPHELLYESLNSRYKSVIWGVHLREKQPESTLEV